MTSLGDTLKQARTSRGVTLDAIARETRIARRYLEALERGDLGVLPGHAFAKGYLRSYAESLGLDPESFLGELERETQRVPEEDHLLEDLRRLTERRAPPRRRSLRLAGAALGGALVAIVSWWLAGGDGRGALPVVAPPSAPEAPSQTAPTPASQAAPTPASQAAPTPASDGAEPPPEPDAPAQAARPTVPGHGVGSAVVDHQLVGRSERFVEGAEVWFWTRVVDAEPGDAVRHVWIHEGRPVMAARLTIGASHWRTYSRLVLPQGSTGRWVVEARTLEGRLLARDEFLCVPSSDGAPDAGP